MRHSLLALALLASLAGCHKSEETPAAPKAADEAATAAATTPDAAFADLSRRALDGWFQLSPVGATQTGDHRYDVELDDLSAEGRQKALDFSHKLLAELEAVDASKLSRENQGRCGDPAQPAQVRHLERGNTAGPAQDPQVYNSLAGSAIYGLMAREFAPMPERLESATARMEKIPGLLAWARANLDPARVPKIHAETVARQNAGILDIVETFVTPNLGQLTNPGRARAEKAITALKAAVAEHQAWLDDPGAEREGRLPHRRGAVRPEAAVRPALLAVARRDQATRRGRAGARARRDVRHRPPGAGRQAGRARTAREPSPEQQQKAIQAALELAYAERPARNKVVVDAEAALARATEFVRAKDLGHPARRASGDHRDAGVPARRGSGLLRLARSAGQEPEDLLRRLADSYRLEPGTGRFVPA
ncbi:DUF885 family protein [Pseudoxanthomonas sp. NC8]|nr:DUF885 family protein [Pseudoxanthomonas sp. NC8]